MSGYTLDNIAEMATISKMAVSSRLKKNNITPVGVISTAGRPINVYSEDVLRLFPQLNDFVKKMPAVAAGIEVEVVKKENPCKGKTRKLSEKLELKLIQQTKLEYLTQADINGLNRACNRIIEDNWAEVRKDLSEAGKLINSKGDEITCEKFSWYWYSKVINRSDKTNKGVAVLKNWRLLWESQNRVNKTNAAMPTARYSYLSMFEEAGLIYPGYGAGLIWVIDGTQLDTWVTGENGKPRTYNYLAIIDGITKMPLYLQLLDSGESIAEVATALMECVKIHGIPPLGIVADNGRAFRSQEIRSLVNSWYSAEQLEGFKTDIFREKFFRNQDGSVQSEAVLFPLAKRPRAVMKATIERTFHEINKHQQERMAVSYIGTRDSQAVSHELGSTPTLALKHALPIKQVFSDFLAYIYTDYIERPQPGSMQLSLMVSKYKLDSKPITAWLHYGGKFNITDSQLTIRQSTDIEPQEASLPLFYFATADKKQRHTVKSDLGQAVVIHNGKTFNLVDAGIFNISRYGQRLTIVIDDVNDCGHVFNYQSTKEFDDKKEKYEKTTVLEYLGTVRNASVQSFSEVSGTRRQVTTARNAIYTQLADAVGDAVVTNKAKKQTKELNYSSYAPALPDAPQIVGSGYNLYAEKTATASPYDFLNEIEEYDGVEQPSDDDLSIFY